jgi:hypothetical protein
LQEKRYAKQNRAWQCFCGSISLLLNLQNRIMKKAILAFGVVFLIASCGNNSTEVENTADSTNINMGSQAPMGDTANQINNRAGNQPMDTSNQNGNDSVKGTNPASRSTTPGGGSDTSRTGHGNH